MVGLDLAQHLLTHKAVVGMAPAASCAARTCAALRAGSFLYTSRCYRRTGQRVALPSKQTSGSGGQRPSTRLVFSEYFQL